MFIGGLSWQTSPGNLEPTPILLIERLRRLNSARVYPERWIAARSTYLLITPLSFRHTRSLRSDIFTYTALPAFHVNVWGLRETSGVNCTLELTAYIIYVIISALLMNRFRVCVFDNRSYDQTTGEKLLTNFSYAINVRLFIIIIIIIFLPHMQYLLMNLSFSKHVRDKTVWIHSL